MPYGEVFIEERDNSWSTPYLFNAKELDQESGLYYFGARYYDPKLGMFLSVDPLLDRTLDPYGFGNRNPIRFMDPWGMSREDWVRGKDRRIYWDNNATNQGTTKKGETYLGKNTIV